MGILSKDSEPSYSPVPDDQSSRSSDELFYDGNARSARQALKRSQTPKMLIALGNFVVLVAYSALLITFTSMWWKQDRLHGADVIDCM